MRQYFQSQVIGIQQLMLEMEKTEDENQNQININKLKIEARGERRLNLLYGPRERLSPLQIRMQTIFKDFQIETFTFHLFLINIVMWLVENLYFYFEAHDWECVQYLFFAKHQPAISNGWEFWRVILASVIFRGWLMFFFNNFALNMLGYCIEKQSRFKMIFTFYAGIMGGHLLSCCLIDPHVLTTGTSCGTIALLPIEICRFIKLRRNNPLEAQRRKRFLILNISSNFILNALAVFGMDPVDWVSHVGCIISGVLCMLYFEDLQGLISTQIGLINNRITIGKLIKIAGITLLVIYLAIMWAVVVLKLPHQAQSQAQFRYIEQKCRFFMK